MRANGRAEARERHPSVRWAPDRDRLRRRVAEDLAAAGHPDPLLAATVLALRGRLRLDRRSFCDLTGVDSAVLAALEDGS